MYLRPYSHRIITSSAGSGDGVMLPLRLLLEQLSVEHSPVQFFSGNSGSVEDDVLWLKTGIRSIMKSLSNCCISLFL